MFEVKRLVDTGNIDYIVIESSESANLFLLLKLLRTLTKK
jgi:hypothetical protein